MAGFPAPSGRPWGLLSLAVWSTTIGAVLGPVLIEPGEAIGANVGLLPLTGPFVFTVCAQIAAMLVYFIGLRPDPPSQP